MSTAKRAIDDVGWSPLVEGDFDPKNSIGRRLILPDFPNAVTLEGLDDWDDVLLLRVRTARGELKEAQIERGELARLAAEAPAPTAAFVDPDDLFILAESVRFATHTPGTRTSQCRCRVSSRCPTSLRRSTSAWPGAIQKVVDAMHRLYGALAKRVGALHE